MASVPLKNILYDSAIGRNVSVRRLSDKRRDNGVLHRKSNEEEDASREPERRTENAIKWLEVHLLTNKFHVWVKQK